jgi:hypothetical protein
MYNGSTHAEHNKSDKSVTCFPTMGAKVLGIITTVAKAYFVYSYKKKQLKGDRAI